MENKRIEFGKRLKALRKSKGLSQYRLANLLDVEHPNVCFWEQGRSYPRIGSLIKLSEVFGVSIDWLLMGKDV